MRNEAITKRECVSSKTKDTLNHSKRVSELRKDSTDSPGEGNAISNVFEL